ncbi:hypothetical protein LSTR_LSTR013451 [Laodelphax striatellus]|uniref:tRNA pseudouridine synthase n=1 Tax=Laodelphax striatellus TaxID=195883 RepID=A0A482WVX5_LAOST|nr:hypothetical protein LSTR_LSTR013451 [Laodelphax striatellus]
MIYVESHLAEANKDHQLVFSRNSRKLFAAQHNLKIRTDAGVHALRTAASVDLEVPNLPPDAITVTLNHYFAKIQCPIRILSTQVVSPDFNCRGLPLYRSYLYRFAVQKADSGFKSDYSFTFLVPTPIHEYKRCHFVHDSRFNIEAVQSVLPLFHGTKDFASFMSTNKNYKEDPTLTTIRRLDSVKLDRGQPLMPGYFTDQYYDYWQVQIVGKSFLYKQIRRTVAVLLGVGQGALGYKDVESLFTNPGSWFGGIRSVPAYGLYLTDVAYSDKDLEAPAEGQTEKIVTPDLKVKPDLEVTPDSKVTPVLKDPVQLSINQKINSRQLKLKQEQHEAVVKNERRKLSTRHAIWLAKSNYAKGLDEI